MTRWLIPLIVALALAAVQTARLGGAEDRLEAMAEDLKQAKAELDSTRRILAAERSAALERAERTARSDAESEAFKERLESDACDYGALGDELWERLCRN